MNISNFNRLQLSADSISNARPTAKPKPLKTTKRPVHHYHQDNMKFI